MNRSVTVRPLGRETDWDECFAFLVPRIGEQNAQATMTFDEPTVALSDDEIVGFGNMMIDHDELQTEIYSDSEAVTEMLRAHLVGDGSSTFDELELAAV